MPFIYNSLLLLFLPLRLYGHRWHERLAIYNKTYPKNLIWFHAVSVGEVEAVLPLIKMVQKFHPELVVLVTTSTATGSARVKSLLSDSVEHVYLPYDFTFIDRRFLKTFQPKLAVIMEKEIWPNLFAQCGSNKIPLFIINARLSENSRRNYKKIPSLVIPALSHVTSVLTQTTEDQQHFINIGMPAHNIHVLGNIKFDVMISENILSKGKLLKSQLFPNRFVWIITSTHQGEDEIFMDMYPLLKQVIPELLLLIVPRHPERFLSVKSLAFEKQLSTVMRSENRHCSSDTDIYIADTMGELKMLYATADISFVGGSLVPDVGGHNILEPLAIGLPVMFGPNMINFKQITSQVLEVHAAIQCQNSMEIVSAVKSLHKHSELRHTLIQNGFKFINKNQGATQRVFNILNQFL